MPIPSSVRAGAWSGRRIEDDLDARVDTVLAAVAERALRCGTRAGLESLLREALRLTGASGAALYDGRTCVARVGMGEPARRPGAALMVWPERPGVLEQRTLARLATFGTSLMAAHAREVDAAARQARLLEAKQRLEQTVAQQERRRSRASHDLRTPLMVIKGYVDMMMKGTAGPLTEPMQRYLDRMMRVANDQGALIERRLARVVDEGVEDLRPLLRSAFIPSARRGAAVAAALTLPGRPVALKGPRASVDLLVRTLARAVAASGGAASVRVESAEELGMWRLRVDMRGGRPLPEKTAAVLRHLAQRLRGGLSLPTGEGGELVAHLPADDTVPASMATH
ncbi:histidine kinase dimerization/phospho-acceptor domain-containing protein [Pyxidicoccus xibeiensis]|uniref:histidine kinase dimerization/phospho-acceptor domain-containing protein n=1 Tax=Pyxidicoccus xibeiensis TaxID=2906759 RepID=UPI0020A78150|nr:histidine kinase dimerization/phospho-acceptor domain-containing protein [Pyxidicoccus xibeiensis]MCP3141163.1 histidine kinase [Pyxidicoccus xibeiensis]